MRNTTIYNQPQQQWFSWLNKAPRRAPLVLGMYLVLFLSGCAGSSTSSLKIRELTPAEATDPYFTSDHRGNPVVCWTEKQPGDGEYLLKYAVFNPEAETFGPPVAVTPSKGTKTSAESAGKVAFKSGGTIVAMFGKRFDDPHNRFAGAIQYSLSRDGGKTWSAARYVHSDTLHRYGRGFFDMAVLSDGEVGAIWLDGRYGEADTGSALFFAHTVPGGGFGPDKMIGESTCECCRTDILTDSAGNIHVAYRDILYPPRLFGRQVRDMVYSRSKDNGRSFSPPLRISADNWQIEGCPHSGPSLAITPEGIQAIWFTAGSGAANGMPENTAAGGKMQPKVLRDQPVQGGNSSGSAGVYQAALGAGESRFSHRKLLDAGFRHPQLLSLPRGGTAMVAEQLQAAGGRREPHSHNGPAAHTGMAAAAASTIILQVNSPEGKTKTIQLTDGKRPAHHAVAAVASPESLLVAWVEDENGVPGIKYSLVDLVLQDAQ